MKTLLLTFGCSWTYGVGVGYTPGMSENDYIQIGWDVNICNKLSWRGLLSDKYNLFNKNFAAGASSNQKQERLATQYFTSDVFREDQNTFDKIILLWGITSTARNEMFSLQENKLHNFILNDGSALSKSLLKLSYEHDFEVWDLARKMRFWNLLFASLNIKNLWFDTFNHHEYNKDSWFETPSPHGYNIIKPGENVEDIYNQVKGADWPDWQSFCKGTGTIDKDLYKEIMDRNTWPFWKYRQEPIHNLLFEDRNPRDLMSLLCIKNGFDSVDQKYHASSGEIDTNRVEYLVKKDILNPISLHPTKQGHVQISDILAESIETLLS